MSQLETQSKVTFCCPEGHRVRGGVDAIGKTVRCPKCRSEFVFAAEKNPSAPRSESREVTDTGVMRILGDMGQLAPAEVNQEVEHRPCSRCGVSIPETSAVCRHCNCYVGAMPSFMNNMGDATRQEF